MNNIAFFLKTPNEMCRDVAANVRARRKEVKLSQEHLSQKAGVSLGSLKRFESSGEISLSSLVKLAITLGCENDIAALFAKKQYASIQEIINEQL